jgi:carboxymethylenebutenolidase
LTLPERARYTGIMMEDFLSRRDFMVTGIGAGFALAVLPVTAWALTTSSDGLEAGPVRIPVGKESMPGYRAMPKGKGPFPVVIVVQEIFGIHEYIQDVTRRLAHQGYLAVAPSLYFRQGDATKISDIDTLRKEIVSKVDQKQVFADLDATLEWTRSAAQSGDPTRAAITGFCWGGGVVWTYCARNPKLKAGVAWYGRLDGERAPLNPLFPLDVARELKIPVLGLYGGKDKGIPLTDVEKMKTALAQGKSGSEIRMYAEAEHGFHADYRPSYHADSAKDGWERMLKWFKKHGVS